MTRCVSSRWRSPRPTLFRKEEWDPSRSSFRPEKGRKRTCEQLTLTNRKIGLRINRAASSCRALVLYCLYFLMHHIHSKCFGHRPMHALAIRCNTVRCEKIGLRNIKRVMISLGDKINWNSPEQLFCEFMYTCSLYTCDYLQVRRMNLQSLRNSMWTCEGSCFEIAQKLKCTACGLVAAEMHKRLDYSKLIRKRTTIANRSTTCCKGNISVLGWDTVTSLTLFRESALKMFIQPSQQLWITKLVFREMRTWNFKTTAISVFFSFFTWRLKRFKELPGIGRATRCRFSARITRNGNVKSSPVLTSSLFCKFVFNSSLEKLIASDDAGTYLCNVRSLAILACPSRRMLVQWWNDRTCLVKISPVVSATDRCKPVPDWWRSTVRR